MYILRAFQEKHGFGVITEILTTNTPTGNVIYEVKFVKSLQAFRFSYDAVRRYGKIDKIKEGDLIIQDKQKALHCVGDQRYRKKVYGAGPSGSNRKNFLLLATNGRQMWQIDTSLKVEYYLPGDRWFDDIR